MDSETLAREIRHFAGKNDDPRKPVAWVVRDMADRIEAQEAKIARLTAKKDALLRAASTSRMAFAGHVSFETAINQLDAALGDAE